LCMNQGRTQKDSRERGESKPQQPNHSTFGAQQL
jgi:hypothetical protein